ncbi:MAG: putative secondary metabolism biosynthetic enzyme [Chrysothrix sp. TS-e1954]|nr:MAG: putative secondary metabolism biosynthetic enzyme [Chrysothrix sp. TS-e1954]
MTNSWLITGGSSGLGLSLGRAVLKEGGSVVLTTRNVAKAREAASDIEKSGGQWLQVELDDPKLEQTVQDAVNRANVDVVVNNAGYPLMGPLEDISQEAIKTQYDANVFGPIRIIQAVTPIFREKKGGTFANIGSTVSYTGMPGGSVYCSTKAALRTWTEALTPELAAFGIRVLMFEPGRFRTNFGHGVEVPNPSGPYQDTPAGNLIKMLRASGPSPGDPDKAAQRMYEVVTRTGMGASDMVKNVSRFPLGPDAHKGAKKVSQDWASMVEATQEISTSTDIVE